MTEPRWLDAEAAASYLSLRYDVFLRYVRDKRVPAPSRHLGERLPRWDREALDALMAGDASATQSEEALNGVLEKIKARGRARRQIQAA